MMPVKGVQRAQDPLDTLQFVVNDVLVQTGKALRASRKDGQGNIAQAHSSLQSKLPDTIRSFHAALDALDSDIIQAKSVLLRDLSQLRAQKQPEEKPPQPVESQSKSPMVIDIDSSPTDVKNEAMRETLENKFMAPFPDMGMGLTEPAQATAAANGEASPQVKDVPSLPETSEVKPEPSAPAAPMAPMPLMDDSALSLKPQPSAPDGQGITDSELNFTDMEFTLAPSGESQDQQSGTAQEENFDLTTFAPTDAGDDLMSLDNLLPPDPNEPPPITTAAPQEGEALDSVEQPMESKDPIDATFDEAFNLDPGVTDGTDFDFSLDGGLGDDTFDDLMNSRDNFDSMEHGDFDAAFFGLDKTD